MGAVMTDVVERLARNEFLGDLPFEFDAMGTMLGHGFHPLKARRFRSIPNLQDVHRQGRTADPQSQQSRPKSAEFVDQRLGYTRPVMRCTSRV